MDLRVIWFSITESKYKIVPWEAKSRFILSRTIPFLWDLNILCLVQRKQPLNAILSRKKVIDIPMLIYLRYSSIRSDIRGLHDE
jgi:hypothetical protein